MNIVNCCRKLDYDLRYRIIENCATGKAAACFDMGYSGKYAGKISVVTA